MIKIRCNICGSNNCRFLFHGRDRALKVSSQLFNIVKCLNCGLVYLNPQLTREELKKYYPENYDQYSGADTIFKYGPLSALIKKFLSRFKEKNRIFNGRQSNLTEPELNYLDFGCGGGAHLEKIRKRHPTWHLYGLDNIDTACVRTKQRGFEVFCGDITELEMPENFFDIINMSHVLEHLNDPKAALLKVNRILKKGGRLIIALPNFDSIAAKFFGRYWHALDVPRHLFFLTPQTATLLLEQTGFSVQKVSYAQGPRVGILSLYYLLGKKDMRINPIIWRIFKPLSVIFARLKKTSVITIDAVKQS